MNRVQVLGTGCAKCQKLVERTRDALDSLHIEAELVKVQDIEDIVAMGAMLTPAIAVDDRVLLSGRVPSTKEICRLLETELRGERAEG